MVGLPSMVVPANRPYSSACGQPPPILSSSHVLVPSCARQCSGSLHSALLLHVPPLLCRTTGAVGVEAFDTAGADASTAPATASTGAGPSKQPFVLSCSAIAARCWL